jgi:hypothetical protein
MGSLLDLDDLTDCHPGARRELEDLRAALDSARSALDDVRLLERKRLHAILADARAMLKWCDECAYGRPPPSDHFTAVMARIDAELGPNVRAKPGAVGDSA